MYNPALPPIWLIDNIRRLLPLMPSVATVERHDEARTPFKAQLGWSPGPSNECLIEADAVFVKYGYGPPPELIEHLHAMNLDRVLVCGNPSGYMRARRRLRAVRRRSPSDIAPRTRRWLLAGSLRNWEQLSGAIISERRSNGSRTCVGDGTIAYPVKSHSALTAERPFFTQFGGRRAENQRLMHALC
jgi:hypothetical protein